MSQRIALLGLSGVGKSTLVSRLNERKTVLHLQASALIKAEQIYRSGKPQSSEELRLGAVADNQALMVAAFLREAENSKIPIVFDAHSVIDGRHGLITISSDVFAPLHLSSVFFMHADAQIIFERRLADVSRERPYRSLETIAEQQMVAWAAAEKIAADIGCSFVPVQTDIEPILKLLC